MSTIDCYSTLHCLLFYLNIVLLLNNLHLFYVLHIHSLSNLRSTNYIETRELDLQQ